MHISNRNIIYNNNNNNKKSNNTIFDWSIYSFFLFLCV